jgi:hypothetical protein
MALSKEYNPSLADDESTTSLLSSEDNLRALIHQRTSGKRIPWLLVLGCSLVLLLTNTLTSYLTHLYAIHTYRSIAEPPSGTPSIFRDLHLPPRPKLLNVTFYDPEHTVYRQHASLEADKAWNDLSPQDGGVFFVKKEDAVHDGINPNVHAYFDAPELGIDGFPVLVEAMHQVHCLVSGCSDGYMYIVGDE